MKIDTIYPKNDEDISINTVNIETGKVGHSFDNDEVILIHGTFSIEKDYWF